MALVRLESLCRSLFLSLSLSFFFRVQTLATVWPPPGGGGHVGKQRAPASEASRLLLGRGGRAKVVVIKSWPWCVLRVCRSLFLSLSFSVFFCVQTLATVWPPPGGGGNVSKQPATASEASRLLLGRGGRAKVVVIESWLWWVLRVFVVLSLSLFLLFS